MRYKPKLYQNNKRSAAFIYAVTFNSGFSVVLVLTLFISFLIQPIHKAFASEDAITVDVEKNSPVAESVALQASSKSAETVTINDSIRDSDESIEASTLDDDIDNEPATTIEDSLLKNTKNSSTSINNNVVNTNVQADIQSSNITASSTKQTFATSSKVASSSNKSLLLQTSVSTTTQTGSESNSDTGETESSSTSSNSYSDNDSSSASSSDLMTTTVGADSSLDDHVSFSASSTGADSTETQDTDLTGIIDNLAPQQINQVEAQSLVTEDNYYQFNRQSCVAIGDGTYHCSVNTETGIDLNAVVYADLGANSNMEIFLRTSMGEVKQLTDNEYEDTSPHYNAESMQVVWQRQIDGRYQIILYDIKEEKEDQLTFSRTNNMEPKVSKEGVVWQAWDGNDWEIMMFDGTYTDQLTDNLTQDVAPAIDDGYVLWSVLGLEEQEAKVYSLKSGETLTINGYEGGVIANPRFVLVYDTMYDNGDVVTQGFDPNTGISAPIASRPADNPVEIPDADGTGETRALIQNKSSSKGEFNIDGTKNVTGSSTSGVGEIDEAETLNLKQASANGSSTADEPDDMQLSSTSLKTTEDQQFLELTDYDLIIQPTNESGSSSTAINQGD